MNGKTCGRRGRRRACATAVAVAAAALVTGCGIVHVHFGSAASSPPAVSPTLPDIAYAQCMRDHGVTGSPVPSPSGSPDSTAARASDACRHLLPGGGTGGGGTGGGGTGGGGTGGGSSAP